MFELTLDQAGIGLIVLGITLIGTFIAYLQERKKRKKLERTASVYLRLATKDPLTGLTNRRSFNPQALPFFTQAARGFGRPLSISDRRRSAIVVPDFSVVFFDIDHFKRVNDTHGHDAGDAILQAFAEVLSARKRELDIVCRWGGEEFLVALPGVNEASAIRFAESVRRLVHETIFRVGNREVKFTISAGVAGMNGAEDLKSLIGSADQALLEAKQRGRNQVRHSDPKLQLVAQ